MKCQIFKQTDYVISSIDKVDESAKEYARNGLKALAHLGSLGGVKNFVRSKGMYNPKDPLSTTLQRYYDKFVNAG